MMLQFVTLAIQGGIIILMFTSPKLLSDPVYVGDANINLARIVSSIIMHLSLYPEIKISLEMLQYITYKGHTFYGKKVLFPFLIFFGKFTGAMMTEALTVYSLTKKTTILDVINGYIATYVIGRIGTIMAATLSSFNINGEMSSRKIMYEKHTNFMDDYRQIKRLNKEEQMNPIQWAGMVMLIVINRLARLSYIVLYFYFIPFFVVVLV